MWWYLLSGLTGLAIGAGLVFYWGWRNFEHEIKELLNRKEW